MRQESRFKSAARTRFSNIGLLSLYLVLGATTLGYAQCPSQKEQVKYFRSVFATVLYEYHMTSPGHFDPNARPKVAATDIDKTYRATFIDLNSSKITDESLKHLKYLPELEYVHISNTKITNAGFKHLKSLKKTRVLTVNNEGIDDRALAHIGKLTSLEELFIDHADITDDGLLKLRTLKNLKKLSLVGLRLANEGLSPSFTEEGINAFKSALPNCEVIIY